ncbi:protein Rf1, mitochondrial-like [Lycium ferocissimum]|uniref:protein Rf1, mitochondrial-like n=1 Tax=Lycium ferocissimum TaxID=112874 RepID=UPI0028163991|nr:protein Rf1, mitochondrial-like [Lycium ferocissimum]
MVDKGCEPNYRTFGVLLKGLQKEHQFIPGEVSVLPERVYSITASKNDVSFELLLDAALEIFDSLVQQGFRPPLSIYQSLIRALCRSSRLKEVEVLFENMIGKQWNNDEIVWTILIDGLLKERESELCMKLLHVMESKSYTINFQTSSLEIGLKLASEILRCSTAKPGRIYCSFVFREHVNPKLIWHLVTHARNLIENESINY